MQHLVVNEVLQRQLRHAEVVKDAAYDDGMVSGIVMAEQAAGALAAPTHARAGHQAVEKAGIQLFKNGFQIVNMTLRADHGFASTQLAHPLGLLCHGLRTGPAAVAGGVRWLNRLAVELGNEDVGNGLYGSFGRTFQQVAQADVDNILPDANRVVEVSVGIEPDREHRHRRARTELAVGAVKDGEEGFE